MQNTNFFLISNTWVSLIIIKSYSIEKKLKHIQKAGKSIAIAGGKRNKAEIVGKSPDNGEGRLKDLWNNSTPFWRREMG